MTGDVEARLARLEAQVAEIAANPRLRTGLDEPAPMVVLDDPQLVKAERARDQAQAAFERLDAEWQAPAFALHRLEREASRLESEGRRLPLGQRREHDKLTKATDRAWARRLGAAEEAQRTRAAAGALRARLTQEAIDRW